MHQSQVAIVIQIVKRNQSNSSPDEDSNRTSCQNVGIYISSGNTVRQMIIHYLHVYHYCTKHDEQQPPFSQHSLKGQADTLILKWKNENSRH